MPNHLRSRAEEERPQGAPAAPSKPVIAAAGTPPLFAQGRASGAWMRRVVSCRTDALRAQSLEITVFRTGRVVCACIHYAKLLWSAGRHFAGTREVTPPSGKLRVSLFVESEKVKTAAGQTPSEQIAFLGNIERLLSEGQFVASYKYALLMSIANLAVKFGSLELYWRHTAPYGFDPA